MTGLINHDFDWEQSAGTLFDRMWGTHDCSCIDGAIKYLWMFCWGVVLMIGPVWTTSPLCCIMSMLPEVDILLQFNFLLTIKQLHFEGIYKFSDYGHNKKNEAHGTNAPV
ncbi:hypothetical protein ACJX0J_006239 [Zea mays]